MIFGHGLHMSMPYSGSIFWTSEFLLLVCWHSLFYAHWKL